VTQFAYYVILFMVGFLSILIICVALDEARRPSPRDRRAKKERKWITIDTSGELSDQEVVTSAGERAPGSTSETSRQGQGSSRAGHVSLDYTSALQRKRRRGG